MSKFVLSGGPDDLRGTTIERTRHEEVLWPPIQVKVYDWLGEPHWYWVNHDLGTDMFSTAWQETP